MPLRIVFCGTPEFAVPSLRHLNERADFCVESVVTQPDRPRGRGQKTSSSAVKDAALEAGIAVYQPEKIRSDSAKDFFEKAAPDAVVIIAYGQIIPPGLIAIPRLGWINLHASLLPRYRGAAPINWAIVNGESHSGLTTMQIDAGLDTGPILLKYETPIGPHETAPELSSRLAEAGAALVAETLQKFDRGEITPTPQDSSQATFARILKREDGRVDWKLPAQTIYNRIRGLQPWPGAFTSFRGKTCHIWGKPVPEAYAGGPVGIIFPDAGSMVVICGQGTVLRVEHVQMEGRNRLAAADFLRGARLKPGERFGG